MSASPAADAAIPKITIITWVAAFVAIYHIAVLSEIPAFMGYFMPGEIHLGLSVASALILIFILRRAGASHEASSDDVAAGQGKLAWFDYVLIAMTLTGVGGLLGIIAGGAFAALVNTLSPFPAAFQPSWVAAAFISSLAVGLFFGLWPAAKAARLDPIEALRHE